MILLNDKQRIRHILRGDFWGSLFCFVCQHTDQKALRKMFSQKKNEEQISFFLEISSVCAVSCCVKSFLCMYINKVLLLSQIVFLNLNSEIFCVYLSLLPEIKCIIHENTALPGNDCLIRKNYL